RYLLGGIPQPRALVRQTIALCPALADPDLRLATDGGTYMVAPPAEGPHQPRDGIGIGRGLVIQFLVRPALRAQLHLAVRKLPKHLDELVELHGVARHVFAFVGRRTLGVRRGWKRERGTSERWKPSPSGRSAARMTLGREFPTLALSIGEAGA